MHRDGQVAARAFFIARVTRRGAVTMLVAAICLVATACPAEDQPDPRSQATRSAPEIGSSVARSKWFRGACTVPEKLFERIRRDYYPGRSPELIALPAAPNYYGAFIGTSHSGPWDYVQKVPIVLYGPGFIEARGDISLDREVTLADIAPTMAELLKIDWPSDRPGKSISEALLDERDTPKMIVLVVWDGGGTNVLDQWPDSWPNLARLMDGGTSVQDALVGSSPSNTPPSHTNMGTGAWPNQHGIVDIKLRDGDDTVDSYVKDPTGYLELTTIGDIYDQTVDNEALVGMFGYHPWHLGMLGRGSRIEGGDKDIAALVHIDGDRIVGIPGYFEFPPYAAEVAGLDDDIETVDESDGEADGLWLGHDDLRDPFDLKHSPAFILYQTRILEQILEREGFGEDDVTDLFFVNYKPIDTVGHKYNMINPEMESSVRFSDGELAKIEASLDRIAGRNEWVMIMTADHGQTPAGLSTGAWPINVDRMISDLANHFQVDSADIFVDGRVGNFWVDEAGLKQAGITLEEIADFLTDYRLEDNLASGESPPDGYEDRLDERLLAGAWPTSYTERISACVD